MSQGSCPHSSRTKFVGSALEIFWSWPSPLRKPIFATASKAVASSMPDPSSAYLKQYFTSAVVLEESGEMPETETHQKNSNII